jgi:formate hydrogenlyase subunit 4
MSVFEYVFSLYSLLLGLALAHLLSGLARVVEARGKVRLGWPTALLALLMMSSLTIFWEIAWRARDAVPDNSAALFASLLICSLLYFAAVLVIPSDAAQRRDLDEHFFMEKGKVLGCLLVANILAYGSRYALMGWSTFAYFSWADWVELSLFMGGCATGIFLNARKPVIAILTLLLFLNLMDPVATVLER